MRHRLGVALQIVRGTRHEPLASRPNWRPFRSRSPWSCWVRRSPDGSAPRCCCDLST